jgi:hypothetical protein
MMRTLLLTLFITFTVGLASAQNVYFEKFIQPTGGQLTDTLDNGQIVVLDLSTDDVEQENDEVDSYFDDDLDAGWEGAPEDQNLLTLGLRFIDVQIPQGATIDSAFVVFHAHEGKSEEDVAELTIVAEATDNALTFDEDNFNEDFLLTDRPQTNAQVEWTVAEEWLIWQPYKTSDIAPVIQEVVDRPGWNWGNALALIFLPEDQGPSIVENAREFTAFENIADPDDVAPDGTPGDGTNWPERRPYLQVWYQGTVGIAELQPELFNLYPNPIKDDLLRINLVEAGKASLEIMNIAGQLVQTEELEAKTSMLDISDLNTGVYFVKVQQGSFVATKRLVIK